MKKVKLISLAFAMLITFVLQAQEKPVSKKHSISIPAPATPYITKLKDTINTAKVSSNPAQPSTLSNSTLIICAISKPLKTEPLYILDGIPINSKQFSKVNPNDIESLKVLKATEATSIYGTQAVNGVIIITTKEEDWNLKYPVLNTKIEFASISVLTELVLHLIRFKENSNPIL